MLHGTCRVGLLALLAGPRGLRGWLLLICLGRLGALGPGSLTAGPTQAGQHPQQRRHRQRNEGRGHHGGDQLAHGGGVGVGPQRRVGGHPWLQEVHQLCVDLRNVGGGLRQQRLRLCLHDQPLRLQEREPLLALLHAQLAVVRCLVLSVCHDRGLAGLGGILHAQRLALRVKLLCLLCSNVRRSLRPVHSVLRCGLDPQGRPRLLQLPHALLERLQLRPRTAGSLLCRQKLGVALLQRALGGLCRGVVVLQLAVGRL
mmetsp:Transcript_38167/g.96621  ORF Transcript_38167/g.96621 Transcript_38167/m.96621 type:complete len:257 (-) Transcript_38167:822-1592(-)